MPEKWNKFTDKLNLLIQLYTTELPARLTSVRESWASFHHNPNDTQCLQELHRKVHSLAGSGATYGFFELGKTARNLEILLKSLLEGHYSLTEEHISQVEQLIAYLNDAMTQKFPPIAEQIIIKRFGNAGPEQRKVVFVVDDDKHFAEELALLLPPAGYEVVVFTELSGVKEKALETRPAAIVMDMIFPEGRLAGAAAAKEILSVRELQIPVVFMSVSDDMVARLHAVRAGGTHFFPKPLQVDKLVQTLDTLTSDRPQDPYRVMIIDDDIPLTRIYSHVLEQEGVATLIKNDPMNVLEEMDRFKPELIMMDVYMPGCRGTELAAIIRQIDRFMGITIVFLSTEMDFDKQMAAMDLGGDDFLTKPIDLNCLVKSIKPRLKRARALNTLNLNLKDSERRYRSVVNTINTGIVLIDREMTVLSVNPTMQRWFPMLWQGSFLSRIFSGASTENHQEFPWLRSILDGRDHEAVLKMDGPQAVRYFRTASSLIPHETENAMNIILTVEDITDQKAAEASLIQANRDLLQQKAAVDQKNRELEQVSRYKSEFLARMSHEIRTPMNGIIGMLDLLMDTRLTAEQDYFTRSASLNADSLVMLLNDILDLSKIEAHKLEFEHNVFDLREMIENFSELMAIKAEKKGLRLSCLIQTHVPTLLIGDPGRLRQILSNLAGNAIKFTDRGEISIRVESKGETSSHITLYVEVTDTGMGIPAEKTDRLFKPFSQADVSIYGKYGGTGLGLTISKQLAELMGGEIGVRSKVNVGTTFWFTITLPRQPDTDRILFPLSPKLKGVPVVVLDNTTGTGQVIAEYLGSWGCRIDETTDIQTALESLAKEKSACFRILIADIQVKGAADGALSRQIRKDPELSGTRTVIVTSVKDQCNTALLKQAGADYVITRPVRMRHLHDCLAEIISPTLPSGTADSFRVLKKSELEKTDTDFPPLLILVADDNPTNLKIVETMLKKMGHDIILVKNGKEAVEAFQTAPPLTESTDAGSRNEDEKHPIDLILMDGNMPVMNGMEATGKIREIEAERMKEDPGHVVRTPIIAVTANAMKGVRETFIESGMDDYLSKPFKKKDLAKVIAENYRKRGSGKT